MESFSNLLVSGNAFALYPVDLFFGMLYADSEKFLTIPKLVPIKGEWGSVLTTSFPIEDELIIPSLLDIVYLSITEHKFYSLEEEIANILIKKNINAIDDKGAKLFDSLVIGMAPYGGVAVWLAGEKKELLLHWFKAESVHVDMSDFLPHDPNRELHEYCTSLISQDLFVKDNLETNGLPPRDLFDKYMHQFTYRYLSVFEKWNDSDKKWEKHSEDDKHPVFGFIEESLFDGTYDKLHDDGLLKYHEAGKPKKLAIKWHIKKTEYSAYLWFEDEKICSIFERFYGAHPETKTDFIIHIDAENKKYELALFRQGLKEPHIIPEDAYQLLVFKNKFEDYRSENYNQERGAWLW